MKRDRAIRAALLTGATILPLVAIGQGVDQWGGQSVDQRYDSGAMSGADWSRAYPSTDYPPSYPADSGAGAGTWRQPGYPSTVGGYDQGAASTSGRYESVIGGDGYGGVPASDPAYGGYPVADDPYTTGFESNAPPITYQPPLPPSGERYPHDPTYPVNQGYGGNAGYPASGQGGTSSYPPPRDTPYGSVPPSYSDLPSGDYGYPPPTADGYVGNSGYGAYGGAPYVSDPYAQPPTYDSSSGTRHGGDWNRSAPMNSYPGDRYPASDSFGRSWERGGYGGGYAPPPVDTESNPWAGAAAGYSREPVEDFQRQRRQENPWSFERRDPAHEAQRRRWREQPERPWARDTGEPRYEPPRGGVGGEPYYPADRGGYGGSDYDYGRGYGYGYPSGSRGYGGEPYPNRNWNPWSAFGGGLPGNGGWPSMPWSW